jgi:6-phosphogluconolactonase
VNLNINNNIGGMVDFVSSSINRELSLGKKVLWFISGGSSIYAEIEIYKKITPAQDRLVITLVDERYGPVGHKDSNYFQLKELGFDIPESKFIPYLNGDDISNTTQNINKIICEEIKKTDYMIGIFGIGTDGHTAGILPNSTALNSKEFVCGYKTELYNRITITPKVIGMLDEAILYAVGEPKWKVVNKLSYEIPIEDMPAQILKKVPLLTIYTDYVKE